jgi:hypothetical protein
MITGMEIGILNGQGLFSNGSFETSQDSGFHSGEHFESHLFGNGLHKV